MNALIYDACSYPEMDQERAFLFYHQKVEHARAPRTLRGFTLWCLLKTFLTYPLHYRIRYGMLQSLSVMPHVDPPGIIRHLLVHASFLLSEYGDNASLRSQILGVLLEALNALCLYFHLYGASYFDELVRVIEWLHQTPLDAGCEEMQQTIRALID
jgi:hypothetical protein